MHASGFCSGVVSGRDQFSEGVVRRVMFLGVSLQRRDCVRTGSFVFRITTCTVSSSRSHVAASKWRSMYRHQGERHMPLFSSVPAGVAASPRSGGAEPGHGMGMHGPGARLALRRWLQGGRSGARLTCTTGPRAHRTGVRRPLFCSLPVFVQVSDLEPRRTAGLRSVPRNSSSGGFRRTETAQFSLRLRRNCQKNATCSAK